MARKRRKYKRLPGRRLIPFFYQSLWQAEDHLLWVETVFFKQQYKRFYYRDIQAVLMRRSNNHYVWAAVWAGFTLVFGLVAMTTSGMPVVSGTMALVFLFFSVLNAALGPACVVHLQTAAQMQRLSALRRVRSSRKAMNLIKVLVEDAQGGLNQRGQAADESPAGDSETSE